MAYAPSTRSRIGALLWALCFQFFVAEQLARSAWTIPYSWSENMISDLGAVTCGVYPLDGARTVCSPWHALMNASLMIQGILIGGGALLLRQRLGGGRAGKLAQTLFVIAGGSLILVGIVPEDVGSPLHVIAATIHLLCGNLALILLGLSLRREPGFFAISWASRTMGTIGLAAILLLGAGQHRAIGPGALERIGGYPLPLLLTGLGSYLMARRVKTLSRVVLGVLFALAGINHFWHQDLYVSIMPPYLPQHRALVIISGVAEVLLGLLLLVPRWSRWAAWGLIALLIAVFPANIHMALHPELFKGIAPVVLWLRLPLQLVLIAWVYGHTHSHER